MTQPFWRQVVLSFSSGSFYRTIAYQPLALSLRYLTLLVLVISIALSARYAVILTRVLGEAEQWAWEYLPEIWIEKGEVKSDVTQPWHYATDDFVFILDTTGEIKEIPPDFPQGFLLSRSELMYKRRPHDIQRHDLSTVESFQLNAEILSEFRKRAWLFWPILLGSFCAYFMIGKSLQIFLFSGVSIATSLVSGRILPYRAVLNIGVYAVTLPFLLGAGILFFGPPPAFFGLVFVAVYGALLVTAVLQCAPPKPAAPEQTDL